MHRQTYVLHALNYHHEFGNYAYAPCIQKDTRHNTLMVSTSAMQSIITSLSLKHVSFGMPPLYPLCFL